jgi:hypothetical protein
MPEFILNRNFNLLGKGYNIRFEKGQPTYVPPEMAREAAGIGAEAIGEKVDALEPEEVPEEQLTADDKQKLFFAAFDKLIERNERDDFDGSGKPSVAALKTELPFRFDKKESVAMYQLYRDAKAEAQ